MKKLIVFLLTALLLAGCGAGKTEPAASVPEQIPQTATEAQNESIPENSTEEAAQTGFVIPFRGVDIPMEGAMEPVLAALGEPKSYTEETSCAFEGLDKTYYYGSLYIQTNPSPNGDIIAAAWFADDSITTPEGIYIGSPRSAVEAAYGAFDGDVCTVARGSQRLMILLENDAVTSVQYTLAQE